MNNNIVREDKISGKKTKIEKILEELCYVYILYFDESKGHIPLLIFPNEKSKNDKKFMRPIRYHPIWFLDIEESDVLDHIDLEFKGFTFFGKKFLAFSNRIKRRAGLEDETPETIIIIISLPYDLDIFGDELIKRITKLIINEFEDKLYRIIDSEITKEEIIKTPKKKEIIRIGDEIKENMKNMIRNTCKEYFSSEIKEIDANSIKKQKAISFLSLKGIDISHISESIDSTFSNIKLFELSKITQRDIKIKKPFEILNLSITEDSNELEILARNGTDKEYNNIIIKISHVKDFFEKEIMNQKIEIWYPNEELLFISPVISHIQDYLFFLIEEESNERLLVRKINSATLKKE
ncbi:MAG: hypothetical protein KGD57_00600 [Candidatus Lokiarchaeota archaeon]|nr:hypothetical protein [Candidatus Lokiarchaeota archaeon]